MDRYLCLPQRLLELINCLYDASDVSDMARVLFNGLSSMISFDSAMFLCVDGDTFELQPGIGWNCAEEDIRYYLDRVAPLDPIITAVPLPQRFNRAIRLSDLTSNAYLGQTEFSEFQCQLRFQYAMSVMAAWNRQPMAVLRLYRGIRDRDFDAEELELLSTLAPHIAHALFLQKVLTNEDVQLGAGILVLAKDRRIIYKSERARRIPEEVRNELLSLEEQDGSLCLTKNSKFYRARVVAWRPPSLLTCFAESREQSARRKKAGGGLLLDGRGNDIADVNPNLTIIAIEPFRRREAITSRLQCAGISSREIEVALRVMSGCSNADIARTLFIDEKTVKDHLSHIYQKVNVHSRTQLISHILGVKFT